MKPALLCQSEIGRHTVLRALDGGRRGGGDSGFGRLETSPLQQDLHDSHLPSHIWETILKAEGKDKKKSQPAAPVQATNDDADLPSDQRSESEAPPKDEEEDFDEKKGDQRDDAVADFASVLFDSDVKQGKKAFRMFYVRRLQELLEEEKIVWAGGLNKPREQDPFADAKDPTKVNRGHFPYIDEQVGLIAELQLKTILQKAHRINGRRHPKWLAIQQVHKRGRANYERRRQMQRDEAKSRMGVFRQALQG